MANKWRVSIHSQSALEVYIGEARTRKQAFHRAELRLGLAGLEPSETARDFFARLMMDHTSNTERASMAAPNGLCVSYERIGA